MADCVCSIVPDHMFEAIANSEHASAELKDHASRSLQHTKDLRAARFSLEGLLHGGDDNNHFGGGGAGGANGGGRYGHGGIFGESIGRYGHGGTYGDGGNGEPPAGKDAQSGSSQGKGSIIHPQMLDAISKSSAARAETKDAALRTKAHDEAADQGATDQAGGAQAAPAPATKSSEQQGLNAAEAQGLVKDDDVDYPDSDYDSYDEDNQTGYAGFYTKKSAAASGSVQTADSYEPSAAVQTKYPGLNRSIINNYSSTTATPALMRSEVSSAPKEPTVNRAFDGIGMTYKLLMDKFGRNSLDNKGKKLYGTVHYGTKYMNACWNGVQMKFGDGDGTVFGDFTKSIDVMAHEMTHGVVGNSCQLVYQDQSGALNESCADIFGSMVKQLYYNKTSANADWLIGVGIVLCDKALRSLKAPGTAYNDKYLGKDRQPAQMSDYVTTTKDNGGVHTNSGIPNKAFYNLATALGGYSWEKAGKIWYTTMTCGQLSKNAKFADFAALTKAVASKDFDADTASAVQKAWGDVGVDCSS